MRDDIQSDLDIYYQETAIGYYEQAVKFKSQNRRAAAQEALQQARFWAFKCPAESILKLENNITNLELGLY